VLHYESDEKGLNVDRSRDRTNDVIMMIIITMLRIDTIVGICNIVSAYNVCHLHHHE
jgi:hypothetical protein